MKKNTRFRLVDLGGNSLPAPSLGRRIAHHLDGNAVPARRVRSWSSARGLSLALLVACAGSVRLAAAQTQASQAPAPAPIETTPSEHPPLEIEVSARRRVHHDPREPSLASTVIHREALEEPGATSADVLARSAGVQVSKSGAASDLATVTLRGASSAQTPVYLAGIRINDDITGTADLSTVPLWMIERVEVYRGNAPERADQLGLGGAIFLHPKQPSRRDGPGLDSAAGLSLGSYDSRAAWVMTSSRGQHASNLIGVRQHDAKNDYSFTSDNGTRFDEADDFSVRRSNADTHSLEAWALGHVDLSRATRIASVVHAFDREQGVTGLGVLPAERARARVRRLLGAVSGHSVCGRELGVVDCELELTTSALLSQSAITDPRYELALGSQRLTSQGRRLTQGARVTRRFSDAQRTTLSVQQSLETLSLWEASLSESASGHYRRLSSQLGVGHHWDLSDAWSVHGLARGECHATETGSDAQWCSTGEVSGRIGSSWRATRGLELLANFGRYVRVPTLGELFGQAPQVGSNPTLESERGYSVDWGVRGEVGRAEPRLYVDSFVFYRHTRDGIVFRRSGLGLVRPYNLARSRTLGLESTARLDATRWLSADVALTWLDPRDLSDNSLENRLIPFYSRLTLAPGLRLHHGFDSVALGRQRLSFEPRWFYRSARVADPAGLIEIPEQSSLDLAVGWSLIDDRMAWRAVVSNLFGEAHFDKVGLPLPGRSFYVSVQLEP